MRVSGNSSSKRSLEKLCWHQVMHFPQAASDYALRLWKILVHYFHGLLVRFLKHVQRLAHSVLLQMLWNVHTNAR